MKKAFDAIDAATQEIKKLRAFLKRKKSPQVRSVEENTLIKATALAWFNNHRSTIAPLLDQAVVDEADRLYKKILLASDRATARKTHDNDLKGILQELSEIKGRILDVPKQQTVHTANEPPDFPSLVSDTRMQAILSNRWEECYRCIVGKAPLAATVMMGGFLETLLLSRINKEPNKSVIFKAKTSPKDNKTGKTLQLKDWTLRNYIDVAHELKWISQSAKDVGAVLRDYRNYIHPYKQFSHGTELTPEDASLFWEITKSISKQLLV